MEKEKILSTLSGKLGETSLSPQTLQKYVELNPIAEGSEPDEAYWNKAVGFLKGMQGQYNHDVATKVEDFKKNFKPDLQNPPSGQPAAPAANNSDGDDTLAKRMEAVEKQLAQEKRKSAVESLRKSVAEKGNDLKVSNKALWADAVKMVELTDDISEEDLLNGTKKVYEAKLKAYVGEGAVPYGGEQRGGQAQVNEEAAKAKREAFKQKMRSQGKLPEKEQNQ